MLKHRGILSFLRTPCLALDSGNPVTSYGTSFRCACVVHALTLTGSWHGFCRNFPHVAALFTLSKCPLSWSKCQPSAISGSPLTWFIKTRLNKFYKQSCKRKSRPSCARISQNAAVTIFASQHPHIDNSLSLFPDV